MDLQSGKLQGCPAQIGSKSVDCQDSGIVFYNGDEGALRGRDFSVDEALF
jgi:hypothetical protein